ncbi:unnamed protein product, partial [Vitis vinifera]|uniref:Uncharacterized protein n=1 Tax=Vitis vinifera TaxID=29760 RepID=D7T3L7_VITVI
MMLHMMLIQLPFTCKDCSQKLHLSFLQI